MFPPSAPLPHMSGVEWEGELAADLSLADCLETVLFVAAANNNQNGRDSPYPMACPETIMYTNTTAMIVFSAR
jgi:hypothetical protein